MKKTLTVIFVTILVLLPTIAGAIIHLTPNEIIQTPINLSGTFLDEDGRGYEFNRNSNAFLASFFDDLDENSSPSLYTPENIKYDKKINCNQRKMYIFSVLYKMERFSFTCGPLDKWIDKW